jgi:hypothetical protein
MAVVWLPRACVGTQSGRASVQSTVSAISCRDITGKIMYQELFKAFENVNNLGGKAWEHAVALDLLNSSNIQDCSIHCFHYQQMFEYFFKHILETKSQFGAYSKSHKLNKLLEEVISTTAFKTNQSKYRSDLIVAAGNIPLPLSCLENDSSIQFVYLT